MFGMSMSTSLRVCQALIPTRRTRIVEFMREPFGGTWIGEPGFFTARQIADGTDIEIDKIAPVIRRNPRHFRKMKIGRVTLYSLPAAQGDRS